MKEKKGFIVYFDWAETLKRFSKEQAGEIFFAMFDFGETGEVPEFEDFAVETAFSFIKRTLERDMEAYEKKCIARSENGKKGGRPKKEESDKKLNKANESKEKLNKAKKAETEKETEKETETETETETYNLLSISSSPAVTEGKPLNVYSDDFLKFWSEYPRKVGKGAAYKIFNKLKLTKKEKDDIMSALIWQKKSEQWLRDNGQYIPHPATYLVQKRWEDEPSEKFGGDITDPSRYVDDEEDNFDFRSVYGE